jgi:maltooligosyltrehalose trehalohydrolase
MIQRQFPIGAEAAPDGVHFRVWAQRAKRVEVVFETSRTIPLEPEGRGYFSGFAEGAAAGDVYRFRLDEMAPLHPDPASRFQPAGPHGPSQIVDGSGFPWSDRDWPGIRLQGHVIYEMHIGTFTGPGTWQAAQEHLPDLADLGITLLEVMPVADFPGNFGWGYDGVNWFAPTRLYGTPDDFRAFVNEAHRLGMGVLLDVVYNHFGPDGNYLREFSPSYFTKRYGNEWGEAINFDGADCLPVREFVVSNACYWISEFHVDGLRLDATQQMFDSSKEHILAEVTRNARAAAGGRSILIVAENETQQARLAAPVDAGGYGVDALWNDDFHHAARVAATGRREAYYSDYTGSPQELISALKWGYLYQGQYFSWQKRKRGSAILDAQPAAFVLFIENHDQLANSAEGARLRRLTSPGVYRALTALMLIAPGTPLLFQGQEFGASSPFLYFADHNPTLAKLVQEGRREFLFQFKSIAQSYGDKLSPPHESNTFIKCKLDHSEAQRNQSLVRLYRDLLRLRRDDEIFSQQRADWMHGAVLGPEAFALRFLGPEKNDRLVVVNLGKDLLGQTIAEPLLAPPAQRVWEMLWNSEAPAYGGCGAAPVDDMNRWYIYSHSAVILKAI